MGHNHYDLAKYCTSESMLQKVLVESLQNWSLWWADTPDSTSWLMLPQLLKKYCSMF